MRRPPISNHSLQEQSAVLLIDSARARHYQTLSDAPHIAGDIVAGEKIMATPDMVRALDIGALAFWQETAIAAWTLGRLEHTDETRALAIEILDALVRRHAPAVIGAFKEEMRTNRLPSFIRRWMPPYVPKERPAVQIVYKAVRSLGELRATSSIDVIAELLEPPGSPLHVRALWSLLEILPDCDRVQLGALPASAWHLLAEKMDSSNMRCAIVLTAIRLRGPAELIPWVSMTTYGLIEPHIRSLIDSREFAYDKALADDRPVDCALDLLELYSNLKENHRPELESIQSDPMAMLALATVQTLLERERDLVLLRPSTPPTPSDLLRPVDSGTGSLLRPVEQETDESSLR